MLHRARRQWLEKADIGRLIREVRERHGMTQQQLAELLEVPGGQGDISRWENGVHQPATETLMAIAQLDGRDLSMFEESAGVARNGGAPHAQPEPTQLQRDRELVREVLTHFPTAEWSTRRMRDELRERTGGEVDHSLISRWRKSGGELRGELRPDTREVLQAYLEGGRIMTNAGATGPDRERLLEYLDRESRAAELRAREAVAAELRAQAYVALAGGATVAPTTDALQRRPLAIMPTAEEPPPPVEPSPPKSADRDRAR